MVERAVRWTETAALQRREILKYWTDRNKSTLYSEKLIKLISEKIKMILQNPISFKLTDFPNTRVSALGHFSIYYQITENELIITAFWDNRQNPNKLLKTIENK